MVIPLKCIAGAALMSGFLLSCASYTDSTQAMREAYSRQDWDSALTALKESGIKDRDRLLWRLELATILDRKGEFQKSKASFLEADTIVDELFTVSVSKSAASFMINDSVSDYEGEDYEKVAIHSMLAHQFIGLEKLDEARISARRIGTRLEEINEKYDEGSKNKYGEDAHGRYLSGIIYESRKEWDNAIIEYWKAIELYEKGFSGFVQGGVPDELVKACYRILSLRGRSDRVKALKQKFPSVINETPEEAKKWLAESGEVIVIHESGRIAPKTASDFFFGSGKQVVRFSFPKIIPRPLSSGMSGIQVKDGAFAKAENTMHLDMVAASVLESRRGRMMLKAGARLLLKGQINIQAEKNYGPLGGLIANVANAATETADTRSWTLLPQAFLVSRVRLNPGKHDVTIRTGNRSTDKKSLSIKAGQYLIYRDIDT
jgi:hypothetical protein